MTVMLVDDDQDDVELFVEAVERIDPAIQIRTASSALDALELLATDGREGKVFPNFLFVDINMPVMTGIELVEILKDDVKIKGTCITMYTTSNHSAEIEKCKKLGTDFITKPFDFDVLVNRLKKAFTRIGSC